MPPGESGKRGEKTLIWQLDFWLLLILIITAVVALQVRDLLAAVAALAAYSFFMCITFQSDGGY